MSDEDHEFDGMALSEVNHLLMSKDDAGPLDEKEIRWRIRQLQLIGDLAVDAGIALDLELDRRRHVDRKARQR